MRSLDVLLVDGCIPSACVAADVLERRGHQVRIAHSAQRALTLEGADILVCDLRLADMDGFRLLEALQGRGQAPRTVFVAEEATTDDYRRAMRIGARDILSKPYDERELVRAVEAGLPPHEPRSRGRYARRYQVAAGTTERATRDLLAYVLRCCVGPATRARIGGACAEAIDNAVRHAYRGEDGAIEVEARIDERELVVNIRDRGVGFDSIGLGLEGLSRCNLGGVSRMCALAEDVRVDSMSGEGTDVELRFMVQRAHFDSGSTLDLSELDFLTPATARMVLSTLEDDAKIEPFHLSPALAVAVGRLLAGPDPRQVLQTALWS